MRAAPSGTPRYAQIAQVLRSRLESRDAADTRPFATEHALCAEFGVSRSTVRQALSHLKREGLVTSQPGVGTRGTQSRVANRIVRSSGDPLHGMLTSKPRIVSMGCVPAPPPVAKLFALEPGEPVFRLTRAHQLDAIPLSVVRSYLPQALAAGVARSEWRLPMHDLLWQRFGLRIARSVHRLRVARAMADVAALLDIDLADPVLRIEASAYLDDGRPLRWTENFFREDRYEYVAEMQWPAPQARKRAAHRQEARR